MRLRRPLHWRPTGHRPSGSQKALHYFARRFYDDVLVSPFMHEGKVDVYVVSDKLQAVSGTVHMRLLDFSGRMLDALTKDVQIPPQSSAIYFSIDKSALAAKGDPRKSFLAFDLQVGGKQVSHNLLFLDVTHNLDLPVAPKIERSLTKVEGGYNLILRSALLARNVYVSPGDLDAQVSDNYFDLLPGEPITIMLKTSSPLEPLENALKITSLTEAFQPEVQAP